MAEPKVDGELVVRVLKAVSAVKNEAELNKLLHRSAGRISQVKSGTVKESKFIEYIEKVMVARESQALSSALKPIVERMEIMRADSTQRAGFEILPTGKSADEFSLSVRSALENEIGVYVFYDSALHAVYVGKTLKQNLWTEMRVRFNDVRLKYSAVSHGSKKHFATPEQRVLQVKATEFRLHAVAKYFSAYAVSAPLVHDAEALLVRSFANELAGNVQMPRFVAAKK